MTKKKTPPALACLAFAKPTKGDREAEARKERVQHILDTAVLRGEAWLRAVTRPRYPSDRGGSYPRCEFCGRRPAGELHHLEGGHGRRTQYQRLSNVALICPECHTKWNTDPRKIEELVMEFCERHSLDLPAYFHRPARLLQEAMAEAERKKKEQTDGTS